MTNEKENELPIICPYCHSDDVLMGGTKKHYENVVTINQKEVTSSIGLLNIMDILKHGGETKLFVCQECETAFNAYFIVEK